MKKEFKYLKKHKALSEKKEETPVNENVLVVNDGELFKVNKVVDIPKKLVNALIRKAKEESGKDPKIFWNDVSVADEIVKYIINTHLDIDSLPASILMGDTALGAAGDVEVETDVDAEEGDDANLPDDLEIDDAGEEAGEEGAEAAEGEEAAGEDVPSLDSEDSEGEEESEAEAEEAEEDLED